MVKILFTLLCVSVLAQPNAPPRPPGFGAAKNADWQAEIQKRIANEEYRITFQKDKNRFHAANRKNNLRAYFTKDGLSLQRRVQTNEQWEMGMRLYSVGRRGQMKPVPGCEPVMGRCVPGAAPGATRGCMRRLEYYHLNVLTIEWFKNSRAGVEQGFEVWLKPPGDGPLRLVQNITGAAIQQAGAGVRLIPKGGRPLDFKGIKARDRRGRKLSIRLLSEGGKLVTEVDDSRAAYPIRVE